LSLKIAAGCPKSDDLCSGLESDHHEFDRLAPLNLCRLRFIR
jgi:hypothetical protein